MIQSCDLVQFLNTATGEVIWSSGDDGDYRSVAGQLTVDEPRELIYTEIAFYGMQALSIEDGSVVWINDDTEAFRSTSSSLHLHNDQLIVQNWKGIWTVDAESGVLTDLDLSFPAFDFHDNIAFSLIGDVLIAIDTMDSGLPSLRRKAP